MLGGSQQLITLILFLQITKNLTSPTHVGFVTLEPTLVAFDAHNYLIDDWGDQQFNIVGVYRLPVTNYQVSSRVVVPRWCGALPNGDNRTLV